MTTAPALTELTLLDEELHLLAPGSGPLPWLGPLDGPAQQASLATAGRSLLVRGLAVPAEDGLRPASALAALLGVPTGGREVQLVDAGRDDLVLTRLRPLAAGGVLVHDTSADGVHLLSLLDRRPAQELLAAALDPLALAGPGPDAEPPAGVVERPDALVRVAVVEAGRPTDAVMVLSGGAGCWSVRTSTSGSTVTRRLDRWRLTAEVEALLGPAAGVTDSGTQNAERSGSEGPTAGRTVPRRSSGTRP